MKEESKIIVIGNYGNYNIGDETILKGLVEEILNESKEYVKVYIPTRNPGFEEEYHNELSDVISSFYVYDFRTFLEVLKGFSRIVIGGGGIWSGYTGPLAKGIPLFSIAMRFIGKKTEFRGIGLYPTASKKEIFLVNLAMLLSEKCIVRDQESYNNLWKVVQRKTHIEEDYAIKYLKNLNRHYERFVFFLENWELYYKLERFENHRFIIGVSIKQTKSKGETLSIINEFSKAINQLNELYKDKILWLFFPFSRNPFIIENDLYITNKVLEKIKYKGNVSIVEHTNPIRWYFLIRDFVDVFIGMRYHSLIYAWMAQKPFFAIPYESKNVEFLRQCENTNWKPPQKLKSKDMVEFILSNR